MIRRHKNRVRGVRGSKPRVSRNGDRSQLDDQYLAGRNWQIFAKAEMAELELGARKGEWISLRRVEADLSFIIVALRQKILQIHRSWPRRLVGQDMPTMIETLQDLELTLLSELQNIGRCGKPGFLEEEDEQDDDDAREAPASGGGRRRRRAKVKTKGK